MIITFQSAAAGDIIMFGDVAQRMMKLMGKIAIGGSGSIHGKIAPRTADSCSPGILPGIVGHSDKTVVLPGIVEGLAAE